MSDRARSVSVVRAVVRNGPLRRVQLAFAGFNAASAFLNSVSLSPPSVGNSAMPALTARRSSVPFTV